MWKFTRCSSLCFSSSTPLSKQLSLSPLVFFVCLPRFNVYYSVFPLLPSSSLFFLLPPSPSFSFPPLPFPALFFPLFPLSTSFSSSPLRLFFLPATNKILNALLRIEKHIPTFFHRYHASSFFVLLHHFNFLITPPAPPSLNSNKQIGQTPSPAHGDEVGREEIKEDVEIRRT